MPCLSGARLLQVMVGAGNILTVGDQKWELLQYHFHTPSEHTIGGRHEAMEAHFVHKNVATGTLAPHWRYLCLGMNGSAPHTHQQASLTHARLHLSPAELLAQCSATYDFKVNCVLVDILTFLTAILTTHVWHRDQCCGWYYDGGQYAP